ncbi:uncharacterized mitochondrial protein AtMg00860-like [Rana temporaria]|uniref:uncharacterized mitochondrial protein AtMg00860-like n=1 Tax=Rana temporaria TaxID=8407 RepID=UPI001AAD5822|nr:uncharacterized mitochondrial protein AtMg00860-like [Rana temporaria]
MNPKKIKAVMDWPAPRNVKEIRFVRYSSFYRKLIGSFSKVMAPITQLTKKGMPFWLPEAQIAFSKLKTLFTSAPITAHTDPEPHFIIKVDASDIGAILSRQKG